MVEGCFVEIFLGVFEGSIIIPFTRMEKYFLFLGKCNFVSTFLFETRSFLLFSSVFSFFLFLVFVFFNQFSFLLLFNTLGSLLGIDVSYVNIDVYIVSFF